MLELKCNLFPNVNNSNADALAICILNVNTLGAGISNIYHTVLSKIKYSK